MNHSCMSAQVSRRRWDVAIVGAGVGGGTLGYELARRGHSVLFIERGYLQLPGAHRVPPANAREHECLKEGWWPAALSHHHGQSRDTFRHPLGCGTGGSSAIFSMVMERFRPDDFHPGRSFRNIGASTVPDAWPIDYTDLEPYYAAAERLYRVRGTTDPLFPAPSACLEPPPPTTGERMLLDCLTDCCLHPYRIHTACERVAGCGGCRDRICSRACRNDTHRMCIAPALEHHHAGLLTGCRVERLECGNRMVNDVVAECEGRLVRIKARVVVLAANAFVSPLILLRSEQPHASHELANSSGLVGKHLMLHASGLFEARTVRRSFSRLTTAEGAMNHGIGLNDFYHIDGIKHGNIHAHAQAGGRTNHADAAGQDSTMFATIVEDQPYADNCVLPDSSTADEVSYTYTIREELRARAANLIRRFADATAGRLRVEPLPYGSILNRSHACGTLRFGSDPRTSVLDVTNRVHDLDNLYVVDASFFPTSGGLNPSLTIAANALRVAAIISAIL
jgi:choline dehydrogenase-like flavoprotein